LIQGSVAGRILAVDFGMKRMGLAVSDALGLTAQGLPSLARTRTPDDLRYIQQLAEEYSVERILLGYPLSQGGEETAMSREVADFAQKLRQCLTCPVELWDERLTSAEANRMLRSSGISIEKRRRAVDRVAATLLLQSHLDWRAIEKERVRSLGEDP
jgi:putative Holliday junction resolvase